ncbi:MULTISPECIES: hypothetical protein [Haloferax]|uniref:Uncharacterized protein n=2 Tax=Haloferax TaxID=2251 RepID=A0A6G1Z296_9EURY|nr:MULTISPECIES: hypothetical protein [Haloferax]KAB1187983.1 hypothetical protein Hfx1149_08035 [Haloferax sp. CBA1149]MRW80652.1 hypothetical protein [Haloferax marinisediminis]
MATRAGTEELYQQDDSQVKSVKKQFDAFFWGGVVVIAGVLLAVDSLGALPQIAQGDIWSWLFVGVGAYALLLGAVRLSSPNYPNPTTDDYFWTAIFLLIGLGGFAGFTLTWPLVVVLFGLSILTKAFLSGRSAQA